MYRRSFIEMLGGIGMLSAGMPAGAAGGKKTGLYLLEQYCLKNGTQAARINEFMSRTLPMMQAVHPGPYIFLEALVAAHMPQFAVVYGYPSLAEIQSIRLRVQQNKAVMDAFEAWENNAEQPYEHCSTSLLQATPYSPEVVPLDPAPKTPRVFELRTYHSPTWRQLGALHERFAGPEVRIFHRSGVHPVLYTSTIIGPNMPNLTYLIPFESLAAREKAWAAFGADPEWVKVRAESIEKHGQISSVMQMSLWRATAYSPIR